MTNASRSFSQLGGVSLLVLACMVAAPVQGAWAADAVAAAAADVSGIGDIVVTAERRQTRLSNTPQSVTAVSAENLAKLNAVQFRDYAATVPALNFTTQGAGQSQINLRGVTTGNNVGPTVGIYVDDVPYGSSSAFASGAQLGLDVGLFDLDRIEVLRGPQGTLYGASSMGGVLKYVTKAPDLEKVGGQVQAELSTTRHGGIGYNGAAVANVPIVQDKIAVRASAYYAHDGGYIDNLALGRDDVNRSRTYGARADLLLKPDDALTIRLSAFGQNIHREGQGVADYGIAGGGSVEGSLNQRRVVAEPFDQRFRLGSGTVNYDFGGANLTSVTSYQYVRTPYLTDYSMLYVPLLAGFGFDFATVGLNLDKETKKLAQELRLASSGDGPLQWIVGGFYTKERSNNYQQLFQTNPDGSASTVDLADGNLKSSYEEFAGFGDLTLKLSDAFEVTGGLRYAHNKQRYEQSFTGILLGSAPETTSSENVVTYLANAKYRISPRTMVYARFATGYRPGGPNILALDPGTGVSLAPPTFKSDTLQSYEAGIKAETSDRSFGIDLSAYAINWNDIQVQTARNGIAVVANAGKAKVYGSELTLTARPVTGLTFTGAFAYADAHLAEDNADLGGVKGETLPNVPRYTAAISGDYLIPAGGSIEPRIGFTLRYVDDRTTSFDGSLSYPQYRLPSYTTLDLRGGARIGSVDVQVFARNIFDVRGQLSSYTLLSTGGAPAQVSILQPRTIGISTSMKF